MKKDETIEKQIEEEPNIFPYVKKKTKNKGKVAFSNARNKKARVIKKNVNIIK